MAVLAPFRLIGRRLTLGLFMPLLAIALLVIALLASALPAHALLPTQPLSLTCYGEVDLHQVIGYTAPAQTYKSYVEVRLSDSEARIQLPQGFRPNANDNGWYKIKYLKATDGDIIGNAIISFIDKPFFRVDRVSGHIDVSGLGATFSGECRKNGG